MKMHVAELVREMKQPGADRLWYIGDADDEWACRLTKLYSLSGVDPWYLVQIEDLIKNEASC